MTVTLDQTQRHLQFESLLEQTRTSVLEELSRIQNPSSLSGAQFEEIVFLHIERNALGTEFEATFRHTADREFPDIVDSHYFGIEVKATKKDDWTSIGNSVLESSRDASAQKIYVFFGKLGGQPDIMYRNYEDCLKGIAVTHYPRYQIDMRLSEGNSIFDKMNLTYDEIKDSSNPVKPIREYYKSLMREGEALWWMDDNTENVTVSAPIIRSLSSIGSDERDSIKADIFAYFPELVSDSTKKYERIPAYLASQYGVVTANLRDNFTAGGQIEVTYEGESFRVPQVIGELLRLSSKIRACLDDKSADQLAGYWQKQVENFTTAEEIWLMELDRNTMHMGLPVSTSDLYRAASATTR